MDLLSIAFSAACSVAKQRVATLLTCHAHGQDDKRRKWALIEKQMKPRSNHPLLGVFRSAGNTI